MFGFCRGSFGFFGPLSLEGKIHQKPRVFKRRLFGGGEKLGHGDLECFARTKFRTEFPYFSRGKNGPIWKKEGFIRTPPNGYGQVLPFLNFDQNPLRENLCFLLEFRDVIVIRGFSPGTTTFLENQFGQGLKDEIVIVIFRKLIPQNKKSCM